MSNDESDNYMGRIENAERNIFFGTLGNLFSVLLGLISRTVFIKTIGITYLGVSGLYANILSVLSLAELGISTAMNYSLYKPIATKDKEKIKTIMQLYKKLYNCIAIIIGVLGVSLIPVLKYLIKDPGDISFQEITLYYCIFLFNTVTTYLVSYKYSLTYAEQKDYIQSNIQVIVSFITLLIQIFVLVLYKNFLIYLLIGSIIGIIEKICVSLYFRRLYPYLSEKSNSKLTMVEKKELKKNAIALIYHKIGDISINQTDNILISFFISISTVGILSNYNIIITSIIGFINTMFYSVISGFANLIITESKERQYLLFKVYRFMGFWIYGMAILFLSILLTPFVTLWLGSEVTVSRTIVLLIMIDYYLKGHILVINNFKVAAGIFDADKYIAIIQGVVNLIASIILLKLIGLPGIFLGKIIIGLMAEIIKPFIIYKAVFHKKPYDYYKDSLLYMAIITGAYLGLRFIKHYLLKEVTILRFGIMFFVILIFTSVIFYITLRKRVEYEYVLQIVNIRYKGTAKRYYDKLCLKLSKKFRK